MLITLFCPLSLGQQPTEREVARLLASEHTRQDAVARITTADLPMLLSLAKRPPFYVDTLQLYIGLADAFGKLKAKEAIPFLIDNISLQRWSSTSSSIPWKWTLSATGPPVPAVDALESIGPEALQSVIHVDWWRRSPQDRLAAILTVAKIAPKTKNTSEARIFLSSVLAELEMERSLAEEGLKLLDNHR